MDLIAILLELLLNPLGTQFVSLTVHRARAKVTLLLAERVGTISTEGRTHRLHGGIIRGGPQILFADEPTGALDTATGIYIAELFKKMTKEEGLTVIMTTHDVRLSELADMLVRLT